MRPDDEPVSTDDDGAEEPRPEPADGDPADGDPADGESAGTDAALPQDGTPKGPVANASPDEEPEATTLREWFSGRPLSARAHLVLGLLVPLAIAVGNMVRLAAFTVDDSYISYRYARNFARGLGLVYNAGERIEGYTNFLYTVLLGAGAYCGADPHAFAKVLGFSCGLVAIGFVYLLERELMPLRAAPALAPYFVATTSVFTGYAVWGLETSLFSALVLAGAWQFAREEAREGTDWSALSWSVLFGSGRVWSALPWSGLLFAAAGLTRPEAPMYLGILMLFLAGPRLIKLGRAPSDATPGIMLLGLGALAASALFRVLPATDARNSAFSWGFAAVGALSVVSQLPRRLLSARNLVRGGIFVGVVGAHLLWRHRYYGAWLPNTFAAKTGDMRQQLAGGLDYLNKFATHEGETLALIVFGLGAVLAWKHRSGLAFAAMLACGTAYVALVGGDWMPLFRFMAPLVPFLALLTAVGLRVLLETRSRAINYGLIVLALFAVLQRSERLNADRRKIFGEEKAFWDRAAGGVATWMNERVQARGREAALGEIAMGDIGQVGYETDFPIVDLLGLVDSVIPGLPGGYTNKTGPGYRDYFFEREPRFFILISAQSDCAHPSVPGSQALYRDRRFRERYAVSGRVHLTQGFSWCVYERRRSIDLALPVYEIDGARRIESDRKVYDRTPTLASPALLSPSLPSPALPAQP